MDGIPRSIWHNFPHPNGLDDDEDRELVPFSDFEVTLARQILSTDIARQQYILLPPVHPDVFLPVVASADDDERVVRELPRRAREHAIYVEYQSDEFGSSDGETSDEDPCEVENPSLFSHRATVDDLITSFHRNTIGPLTAPPALLPDDTLETALDHWDAEQAEHSLEMRWRATKRVAENWLTRMRPLREKQYTREKERERSRKRDNERGGMGKLVATTRDGTSDGLAWPTAHPLVQHMQRRAQVPSKPGMVSHPTNAPPPTSLPIAAPHADNSQNATRSLPGIVPAPRPLLFPSSAPPTAPTPAQHPTESPNGTDFTTSSSTVSTEQIKPLPANTTFSQHPQGFFAQQAQPAHVTHPPGPARTTHPLDPAVTTHQPAQENSPQQTTPPYPYAQPQSSRPPLHIPYDPRSPFFKELPLEDLIHIPPPADRFADGYAAGFADGVRRRTLDEPPPLTRRGILPHAGVQPRAGLQNAPPGYAMGRGHQVGYSYAQGHPNSNPQSYALSNGHAHPQHPNGNAIFLAQHPNVHSPNFHAPPQLPSSFSVPTPNFYVNPSNPQFPSSNPHPSAHPLTAHLQGQLHHAHQPPKPQARPRLELPPPGSYPTPPLLNPLPYPLISQPANSEVRPQSTPNSPNVQSNHPPQPPRPPPPQPHVHQHTHPHSHPHPHQHQHQQQQPHLHQLPHVHPPPLAPSERDKIIRHLTLLADAPRITAGQVLVRHPGAVGMVELFLTLFPEQRARAEAWGLPVAKPRMGELEEAKVEEVVTAEEVKEAGTEAVEEEAVAKDAKEEVGEEATADTTPEPTQSPPHRRPTPVIATDALPAHPARDSSTTASPLTLCTDSARVRKHWFEPDAQAIAHLRVVVDLMERKGGWRRPDRKVRLEGGETHPRGPDDIFA